MTVVDAFTDSVFSGNPAAVIITDSWLSDELMQSIAAENNLSETAFLVLGESSTYQIRLKDKIMTFYHGTFGPQMAGMKTL